MTAYHYRHFGLTLASTVVLPGLPDAPPGPADITIEIARGDAIPTVEPPWAMVDPPRTAWRAPGEAGSHLRLQFLGSEGDWGEFVIDEPGERVQIAFGARVDLGEVVQLLVGSPFSCVLAQRGATCVHASVIEHRGRAIAFVGPKRSGKSTLALACVQQGARLVSDDVAAIALRGDGVAVAVAGTQLRVAADTALLLSADELRPIWAVEENRPRKRYHDTGQVILQDEVPLTDVYLLAPRGAQQSVARDLTPGELLPRLIAERHMAEFLDREGHRRDFTCLAAVVERVTGRELQRPDDLENASVVAGFVLNGGSEGPIDRIPCRPYDRIGPGNS